MPAVGRGTAARKRSEKQALEAIEAAERRSRAIEPLQAAPRAPKHLGAEGRRIWRLILGERFKSLTRAEVVVCERYCEMQDRRKALLEALAANGWSTSGSRPGMRVLSPEATALEGVERELRQVERVLGLGPSHRAKLSIDLISVELGLDALEQRRQMPDLFDDDRFAEGNETNEEALP